MKHEPIEIVIADDHAIVRQGLRKLLEEENFKVLTHKILVPSDSSIALGQIFIASKMK